MISPDTTLLKEAAANYVVLLQADSPVQPSIPPLPQPAPPLPSPFKHDLPFGWHVLS